MAPERSAGGRDLHKCEYAKKKPEGEEYAKITGLGNFIIGQTTPDSLSQSGFTEQDPFYVKGTIALPCPHIRGFTAERVAVTGVEIPYMSLLFYDNRLFRIVCSGSDTLTHFFVQKHGKGKLRPPSRFVLCEKDKPTRVESTDWQNGDVLALIIRTKGYTADCRPEERTQLVIAGQRLSQLSSDCELPDDAILTAELDQIINQARR